VNGSNIRVYGFMAEDAQLYVSPSGQAEVGVRVVQADPRRGIAVGRFNYGHGYAAQHAAAASARHMRKGEIVTVHADGWRIDGNRLVLLSISLIAYPTAPDHTSTEQAVTA
jgi:hypothetical protein